MARELATGTGGFKAETGRYYLYVASHYAEQVKEFHRLFEERTGQNRTTTDISDAARLATFGGIDSLRCSLYCS